MSDVLAALALVISAGTLWLVAKALPSYLSAYLGEKGKRLATHEDLAMVLAELKETTRATEEVRTLLSEELWKRQEQWKLKRDIYLKAIAAMGELFNIQLRIHQTERGVRRGTPDELVAHMTELGVEQKKAMAEFRAARAAAAVALSSEAVIAMDRYQMASSKRSTDDPSFHELGMAALHDAYINLAQVARKELGLPPIGGPIPHDEH